MSQEQLLAAILDEIRGLRQCVEQQTLLSAHASRSQEYGLLQDRFKHLLPPENGLGGSPSLAHLWTTIRGTEGWRDHLSADQLGLLLCRDERLRFVLREEHLDVPAGFVEEVLSRLPRLEQLSVRGMRCQTHFATLQTVPSPFPFLQRIDLRETAVTDVDLLYLVQLAPALRRINASNCPNLSPEGIAAAQQRNGSVVITPATREEKQIEDATRALDVKLLRPGSPEGEEEYSRLMETYGQFFIGYEREECLDGRLLALWTALGGTNGWRRSLRPAQLTLLLSRLNGAVVSCVQGREEHYESSAVAKQQPATTVAGGEMVGFVTQVLSRLPQLRRLIVWDSHRWPVEWAGLEVRQPFRSLWYAQIRHTPYSVGDLSDFAKRVPSLVEQELRVDKNRLPASSDVHAVQRDCLMKVKFL